MTNEERRELRYQRRKQKREQKKQERINAIGTLEDVFVFHDMFKYGKECCKGVRWKCSCQIFELHLFSRTARNRRNVINGYHNRPLYSFSINERGKQRDIEAPHIDDRQIHKTLTKKVLLPLYLPTMIYDNGASLKGKGLLFSQTQFDKSLKKHYNKYGMEGSIIIADCSNFFPSADRQIIKSRHQCLLDKRLVTTLDMITEIGKGKTGVPLGIETAQLEMISLPSPLDNYMACQVGVSIGHYMDDYHILVPPNRNPYEIASIFVSKAAEYGLTIKPHKIKIIPFGKPFKFCKAKRMWITEDKIIKRGCPDSIKRTRRKIHSFKHNSNMTYEDIYQSVNASLSYLNNYNNHKAFLRLSRLFYYLYGYNPLDLEYARRLDGLHNTQTF